MHFQWYPGHMTKAKRMMQENIKLIDLVIELVDARIPVSSRNPDIDELGKNKARLILLNKSDLAEEKQNDAWAEYFKEKGFSVVKVINALAGKACAKTGNKPGVTKGKQWIRLNKNVELLDTPGILWPKFEDQTVGLRLAFIGSIKDEILNTEELAMEMITFLTEKYPGVLEEKYSVEISEDSYECLRRIAESRHCLVKGNELDTNKAAILLIDDFRSGKLGRITLEFPEDYE